jgi:hypothetical protein
MERGYTIKHEQECNANFTGAGEPNIPGSLFFLLFNSNSEKKKFSASKPGLKICHSVVCICYLDPYSPKSYE